MEFLRSFLRPVSFRGETTRHLVCHLYHTHTRSFGSRQGLLHFETSWSLPHFLFYHFLFHYHSLGYYHLPSKSQRISLRSLERVNLNLSLSWSYFSSLCLIEFFYKMHSSLATNYQTFTLSLLFEYLCCNSVLPKIQIRVFFVCFPLFSMYYNDFQGKFKEEPTIKLNHTFIS